MLQLAPVYQKRYKTTMPSKYNIEPSMKGRGWDKFFYNFLVCLIIIISLKIFTIWYHFYIELLWLNIMIKYTKGIKSYATNIYSLFLN